MRYTISGKNINITPGLKDAVESKLGKLERYFSPDTEVQVTLSVEKGRQKIEVTIPVKGSIIRAEQDSNDMYVSVDLVEEIIERQIKKYKTKIVDKKQSALAFSEAFLQEEAEQEEKHGNYVTEVEGGYRRIVAAPKPQGIIEIDSIKALSDQGQVVIACGGGGIPVLAQGVELHGASAVIEKDYASGRMAELLNADVFMVLTSVENVCVGYNTEQESPLEHITVAEAQKYIDEGQFEPNTMLPKIEAGVSFLEKGNGRKVIITSIDKALEGYLEKTGTIIE